MTNTNLHVLQDHASRAIDVNFVRLSSKVTRKDISKDFNIWHPSMILCVPGIDPRQVLQRYHVINQMALLCGQSHELANVVKVLFRQK